MLEFLPLLPSLLGLQLEGCAGLTESCVGAFRSTPGLSQLYLVGGWVGGWADVHWSVGRMVGRLWLQPAVLRRHAAGRAQLSKALSLTWNENRITL